MKILFDECVPWPMRKILIGHVCNSLQQCGWNGVKNGALLKLAESKFDLFLTCDQSIRFQQNLTGYRLPVLQLSMNNLRRILAAASSITAAVAAIHLGSSEHFRFPSSS